MYIKFTYLHIIPSYFAKVRGYDLPDHHTYTCIARLGLVVVIYLYFVRVF